MKLEKFPILYCPIVKFSPVHTINLSSARIDKTAILKKKQMSSMDELVYLNSMTDHECAFDVEKININSFSHSWIYCKKNYKIHFIVNLIVLMHFKIIKEF